MTGIDIRIANGLARRLGVKTEFVRTAKTTDALVQQAASGQVDIAISFISRTVTRSLQVRLSRPYVTEHVALALNRRAALQVGVKCPESRDDLASLARGNWKIGAQRGTTFESVLSDVELGDSMALFDDIGSMLAAVQSGTHIGGLAGEVALRYAMKVDPALRVKVEICTFGEQKDNIAVAIRPDAPNLKEILDIAFDNVAIQVDAHGVVQAETDWDF
ncbi:MAG: transporter substrate-binding domain-containing protein [Gammaproteobacteria bacterium]